MDKIRIIGGIPLKGSLHISGAKNAALPLMAASLLTSETLTLKNVPQLTDVQTLTTLLEQHGVSPQFEDKSSEAPMGRTLKLTTKSITSSTAPYELVRKMRASVVVLGPLVARTGEAKVSLPGGCAIGARAIDVHIQGLEKLGAKITLEEGYVHAKAPKGGLKGADIVLPIVTVTGTENLMMAATLAKGTTRLLNAAQEPEVADLARCLNAMGASISGIGTATLIIEGVEALHGAEHHIISDRIEAGTYAIAAAITGGDIELKGARLDTLQSFVDAMRKIGIEITKTSEGLRAKASPQRHGCINLKTQPYPGLATDLQAQCMALLSLADGSSLIEETIFENRFMHVPELVRMGADITINGRAALVRGVSKLRGAEVMATDLRASVSLVLAGLAAEGTTTISRVYHLDRGYESLEQKLSQCGAKIERLRKS